MFRKGGTAVLEKYFCVCFSLQRDTKRWLRVLAHSNARALLIDPIELPNHGVVACGWA